MSTPAATPPTEPTLPVNEYALTRTGASMTVDAKIQVAKAKAKAAREEAEKADKEAAEFGKNRRDEARNNDRRALLVGRALLARSVADRTMWNDLWPDLVASLGQASDDDRALVGLPPLVVEKPSDEGTEQSVAAGKPDAKSSGLPTPVAQTGKDDEQPGDERRDEEGASGDTENGDEDKATVKDEKAAVT